MSQTNVITPFIERRKCERVSSSHTHAHIISTKHHLWKVIFGVVTIDMLASLGNLFLQRVASFDSTKAIVPGPGSVGLYRWDGYHRIAGVFHLKQP